MAELGRGPGMVPDPVSGVATLRPVGALPGLVGIRLWDLVDWVWSRHLPVTGLWLVEWDDAADATTMATWVAALPDPARARLHAIGPRPARLRYAASHAALIGLVGAGGVRSGAAPGVAGGDPGRQWSLSHTRWCAAVATATHPIGVDLEADIERPWWRSAARATRSIGGSPPPRDGSPTWPEFLVAWTRAEARVKAGVRDEGSAAVSSTRVPAEGRRPDHVLALAWRDRSPAGGGDARVGGDAPAEGNRRPDVTA